jgi:hypothetical protein
MTMIQRDHNICNPPGVPAYNLDMRLAIPWEFLPLR